LFFNFAKFCQQLQLYGEQPMLKWLCVTYTCWYWVNKNWT